MERDAALADFDAARQDWESAFARVPDEALAYLKDGDDYALGGLQVHVNWVLAHYQRVLDALVRKKFRRVEPEDPPGAEQRALEGARRGLLPPERAAALEAMARMHAAIRAALLRMPLADWSRKAPVVYGAGQDPYPTSAEDIAGWLTDHYHEHVQHSAELVEAWNRARAGG